MVEVVLRNRLHAAASAQFAKSDWYQDVLKHHGDLLWHNKIAVNPSITNDYYRKGAAPHDKKKHLERHSKKAPQTLALAG